MEKTMKNFTVYFTSGSTSYAKTLTSVEFSDQANADAFIEIMKAEGYEITTFGNEGYLGAEAEQEKRDEKAVELNSEYQAKIDALSEAGFDGELEVLRHAAGIYEDYLQAICDLYECEAGVGDGFTLDLTSLGDEFFTVPNPGYDDLAWQYDHLYERIERLEHAVEFVFQNNDPGDIRDMLENGEQEAAVDSLMYEMGCIMTDINNDVQYADGDADIAKEALREFLSIVNEYQLDLGDDGWTVEEANRTLDYVTR